MGWTWIVSPNRRVKKLEVRTIRGDSKEYKMLF